MSETPTRARSVAAPKRSKRSGEAPRRARLGGLVAFLNSPLGLWFLSTVFISAGSWIYTEWRESREAWRARQERIERLDLEITNRLDHVDLDLSRGALTDRGTGEYLPQALANLPALLMLPPDRTHQLFPEYANRGLRLLLIELHTLLEGTDEFCVYRAILQQRAIQSDWLGTPLTPEHAEEFRVAVQRLNDGRWSLATRERRLLAGEDGLVQSDNGQSTRYCPEEEPNAASPRGGRGASETH